MEEQSQVLLDQVAFFNNGEEEEAPVSRAPKSRAPKQRGAHRPEKRPAAPARRTKPRRGKASNDQEWEEF